MSTIAQIERIVEMKLIEKQIVSNTQFGTLTHLGETITHEHMKLVLFSLAHHYDAHPYETIKSLVDMDRPLRNILKAYKELRMQ